MDISITQTSITAIEDAPNSVDLLAAYAAESCIPEIGTPTAQWNQYRAIEMTGIMRTLVAHDGDKVVGFVVLLLSTLPHYGEKVATTESFFVLPEYRSAGLGLALLRRAEKLAASEEAKALLVSAPYGGKLQTVLNASRRYRPTNTVFTKRLIP